MARAGGRGLGGAGRLGGLGVHRSRRAGRVVTDPVVHRGGVHTRVGRHQVYRHRRLDLREQPGGVAELGVVPTGVGDLAEQPVTVVQFGDRALGLDHHRAQHPGRGGGVPVGTRWGGAGRVPAVVQFQPLGRDRVGDRGQPGHRVARGRDGPRHPGRRGATGVGRGGHRHEVAVGVEHRGGAVGVEQRQRPGRGAGQGGVLPGRRGEPPVGGADVGVGGAGVIQDADRALGDGGPHIGTAGAVDVGGQRPAHGQATVSGRQPRRRHEHRGRGPIDGGLRPQRHVRAEASLAELHAEGVRVGVQGERGPEHRGRARRHRPRGPGVLAQHAVHPHAHAVVADPAQGVGAGGGNSQQPRPADAERVVAQRRGIRRGLVPVEVDRGVAAHQHRALGVGDAGGGITRIVGAGQPGVGGGLGVVG